MAAQLPPELLQFPSAEYTYSSAGQITVVETCPGSAPAGFDGERWLEGAGFTVLPSQLVCEWAHLLADYRRGARRTPAWMLRRMLQSPGFYVAYAHSEPDHVLAFADVRQPPAASGRTPNTRYDHRTTLDEFEIAWRPGEAWERDQAEADVTRNMSDWAPPLAIRAASAILLRLVEARPLDAVVSIASHAGDVRSESGALWELGFRPRVGRRWPKPGSRLEATTARILDGVDSFTDIVFSPHQ